MTPLRALRLLPAVFVAACSSPSSVMDGAPLGPEVAPNPALPPPTAITLTAPAFAMVRTSYNLDIEDMLPGEMPYLVASAEIGEGPCHRFIGGYCLDLIRPLEVVGRYEADDLGRTRISLEAPPWPGTRYCFQATVRRGLAGAATGLSEPLCIDFCAAVDGDGDGICDTYDVCPGGDDLSDRDGDGICDALDLCPTEEGEPDADGDGVCDLDDTCPGGPDDVDTDDDGVCDTLDACEGFDDRLDEDGDGIPDDCAIVAPECEAYSVLDESWRNVATMSNGGNCDTDKIGWYRIEGPAGTHMPETAPIVNICGTDATGWLNAAHPARGVTLFGAQVCFHWSGSTCNFRHRNAVHIHWQRNRFERAKLAVIKIVCHSNFRFVDA